MLLPVLLRLAPAGASLAAPVSPAAPAYTAATAIYITQQTIIYQTMEAKLSFYMKFYYSALLLLSASETARRGRSRRSRYIR